jgi:hypothetical protein
MGSAICKGAGTGAVVPGEGKGEGDEPNNIPVVDRKASDLSKFGGVLVKTNGNKDMSGDFSFQRAKELCELCKLVYFFGADWASKKKPPKDKKRGECNAPAELSMPLRFTLGDLTRTNESSQNHRFNIQTLDKKYDDTSTFDEKTLTWRNGFLFAPQSDTEGMLLIDQDRKFATLVMRGTSSATDVLTDIKGWKRKDPTGGKGYCHSGIANAYEDIAKSLYKVVSALFKDHPSLTTLFVTGHSLGGGLATLAAKGIKLNCPQVKNITMYSYGGAIVGNTTFKREYDALIPHTYRLVNDRDMIPQLGVAWPTNLAGFNHVGKLVFMNDLGVWLDPKPAVLRINTGQQIAERATDHLTGNYMKIIKKYRAYIHLGEVKVQRLKSAWEAYLVPTVSRVEYSLTRGEDDDSNTVVMPEVQRQVLLAPNLEGLRGKLAADLSKAGITAEVLLVETNRQALSTVNADGASSAGWEHFVAAGAGVLYEPNQSRRDFRLTLGEHMTEFEKYDQDNDGYLNEGEFVAMRAAQGYNDGEKCLAQMKGIDIDNDGLISQKEYSFWRSISGVAQTSELQEIA